MNELGFGVKKQTFQSHGNGCANEFESKRRREPTIA